MSISQNHNLLRKIVLSISIAVYGLSLTQKCFCTESGCGESGEGFALLFSGAFGWFSCSAWFAWLANPFLLVAWFNFMKEKRMSLITSAIAFVASIYFLSVKEMMINEGGGMSKIVGYNIGYYLWLAASIIILLGNIILPIQPKRPSFDFNAFKN